MNVSRLEKIRKIEKGRVSRVLRDYQRTIFYDTLKKQHNALFLEMRLGKTLITIRSIEARFNSFFRALIVCPFSAFDAWESELLRERNEKDTIVLLTGDRFRRKQKFIDAYHNKTVKWFILNIDGWRVIPEIAECKWDAMVCDESYFLQAPPHVNINKKTKEKTPCTSKFFTDNFRDVQYKYVLSGTPAPESELNYFMQLLFLDRNILYENNYWAFRHKYFVQYSPHNYTMTEKGRSFLTSRLSTCATFLSRKDVNLGGEKIYETRKIELDRKARKIYDDIWDNFVINLDNDFKDATDIGGVRFQWARRLFGGFVYYTDEMNIERYDYIFSGKMDEIKSLLSTELINQQIVIWAHFTKEIDLLLDYMQSIKKTSRRIDGSVRPEDRINYVKSFREGKVQYLICQPQAAQYSFDMSNADTEIFFSSPVSLKDRLQSEDRLISSKTNSVLIIDLACKDTIEEDILDSLRKKETNQAMIKRIVQRLKGYK